MSCAFGEMGVSAEKVGHRAARMMDGFLTSNTAVDLHLADQLLLPLAIAGGGSFTCGFPDDHLTTNQSIIEAFLPTRFTTTPTDRGCRTVNLS
jgi:RNA 3'-terminal phosphate cyclase (ATP)